MEKDAGSRRDAAFRTIAKTGVHVKNQALDLLIIFL